MIYEITWQTSRKGHAVPVTHSPPSHCRRTGHTTPLHAYAQYEVQCTWDTYGVNHRRRSNGREDNDDFLPLFICWWDTDTAVAAVIRCVCNITGLASTEGRRRSFNLSWPPSPSDMSSNTLWTPFTLSSTSLGNTTYVLAIAIILCIRRPFSNCPIDHKLSKTNSKPEIHLSHDTTSGSSEPLDLQFVWALQWGTCVEHSTRIGKGPLHYYSYARPILQRCPLDSVAIQWNRKHDYG